MPHISCKVITSYRCSQTAPPICSTQVSNQLLFFINNQQVRITLHPQTYWACQYLHWKTHRNKSASVPMSWSPFFFMIPLIEYDCMNSLTLLDCSMTRKGWSPLGRQSPQCSWLDLIWFPSSINPTLEYAVFLYGSCISLTEVWLQPYPATLQQVVNTIRCTALLHSSWWF